MGHHLVQKSPLISHKQGAIQVDPVLVKECRAGIFTRAPEGYFRDGKMALKVLLGLGIQLCHALRYRSAGGLGDLAHYLPDITGQAEHIDTHRIVQLLQSSELLQHIFYHAHQRRV